MKPLKRNPFSKVFFYSMTNHFFKPMAMFSPVRFSTYTNFQSSYKVFLPSYSDQKIEMAPLVHFCKLLDFFR